MQLDKLLKACRKGDQESQFRLYRHFYAYAMGVCLRYADTKEDAQEIAQDGFVKMFNHLDQIKDIKVFKAWFRKIMVRTAIDHFRVRQNKPTTMDISHAPTAMVDEVAISKLSQEEILKLVQQLPPAYRMVFNLHVLEGFKHPEIAKQLNITVGTSKSNLAKARIKLKKMLSTIDIDQTERYG